MRGRSVPEQIKPATDGHARSGALRAPPWPDIHRARTQLEPRRPPGHARRSSDRPLQHPQSTRSVAPSPCRSFPGRELDKESALVGGRGPGQVTEGPYSRGTAEREGARVGAERPPGADVDEQAPAADLGPRGRLRLGGTHRPPRQRSPSRSEEHTSELQSLMRISYAVFC